MVVSAFRQNHEQAHVERGLKAASFPPPLQERFLSSGMPRDHQPGTYVFITCLGRESERSLQSRSEDVPIRRRSQFGQCNPNVAFMFIRLRMPSGHHETRETEWKNKYGRVPLVAVQTAELYTRTRAQKTEAEMQEHRFTDMLGGLRTSVSTV